MESSVKQKNVKSTYLSPLLAGAVAGISVDVTLYPLDTLKTRLQSAQGFQKAGGFKGMYKEMGLLLASIQPCSEDEAYEGANSPRRCLFTPTLKRFGLYELGNTASGRLLTVATTSMPTTALFFVSYETTKTLVQPRMPSSSAPFVNMFAASVAEVLACLIRVPTEIAKQRKQTYVGTKKRTSIKILFEAYKSEGVRNGLYRGFFSTVARDLPFSFIELPVWEMLKTCIKDYNNGQIDSFQSALCGSLAGGFAAAVTTPLDLAKTRIMLAEEYSGTRKLRIRPVLTTIYLESGFRGLFAGVTPRLTAFMFGGFVFFGVYDHAKGFLESHFESKKH